MIIKEICKDYALKVKEETGSFPVQTEWVIKQGAPVSLYKINKIFGSYADFKIYCGEPVLKRRQPITMDWLKNNCYVDDNNCWNWLKFCRDDGYPLLSENGISQYVHRVSYEISTNLQIPKNKVIRHKCDNKRCCNPEHLELGSTRENGIDARNYSKSTKLTEQQVRQLKQELLTTDFKNIGDKGKFDKYWAEKFVVSRVNISSIRLGYSWKDIIV